MLMLHHYLHSQHLRFLKDLHCLRLLLDTNQKGMLVVVYYLAAVPDSWISQIV